MRRHSSYCLLALLAWGCRSAGEGVDPNRAELRFGVVADIQYADKDTVGGRRYRDGLANWKGSVAAFRGEDLDFVVQLGDLIDGRETVEESTQDLNFVLGVAAGLDEPLLHVLGNHCLAVPRRQLLSRLRLEEAYYSVSLNGWRLVVLDTQAISTCGWQQDTAPHVEAQEYLTAHAGEPNAKTWNGAVGEVQRAWLAAELAAAREANERVIVFAHAPVLEAASTPAHLAWDHAQVVELLTAAPCVVAYFAGHDHAGGYAEADGIHFVTVPGMVEADPAVNAYGVVEVYGDRIEVLGTGELTSRTLALRAPEPADPPGAQSTSISTE